MWCWKAKSSPKAILKWHYFLKRDCCSRQKQDVCSWSKTASVSATSKKSNILHSSVFTVPTLHYVVLPLQPCFAVDWGKDKIKATAAISSLLAPWQIGPLSNRGLIYQAKDGYWNCPTSHKSDQWIGLYLRQGRHHSVAAGRRGTRPFKSLSCISLLMDVACLTSLWPGAAGQGPNLCLTWIIIWLHACVWFCFSQRLFVFGCSPLSWHASTVRFSPLCSCR